MDWKSTSLDSPSSRPLFRSGSTLGAASNSGSFTIHVGQRFGYRGMPCWFQKYLWGGLCMWMESHTIKWMCHPEWFSSIESRTY